MKQLTEITSDYKQRFDVVLEDNSTFELKLEYIEQQGGWFYSFIFGNLTINGSRVVTGLNILRPYKNLIPFGISIATDDLSEPIFVDDFENGRATFSILNEEEVEQIETDYYNN